ncbi:hypothetical protein [Pontibacter saemangeumensis]
MEQAEVGVNNCRKCGAAVDEFSFEELPKEEQLHWEKLEYQNQ